jgi:hypothetical protein
MYRFNWITRLFSATALVSLLTLTGCGGEAETDTPTNGTATGNEPAALSSDLFLATAPEGAQPITELKKTAEEGDEVIVRAVVGGRKDPIVDGRASAAIVDAGLENICIAEDDHCPTPWDYCCAIPEQLQANMANVQIVDDNGRVVAGDLGDHMKPLSTVVVRGVVGPRPAEQMLTINATGIYVEPTDQP